MRFTIEHEIGAPRAVVELALADPAFYARFGDFPNLAPPEVLDRREEADAVVVEVRYAFTGELSGSVRAAVDPSQLTWVSTVTVRPERHQAELVLTPDHYGDRIECSGLYVFTEKGEATTESVDGDLVVHVPIFGRTIEQAILGGVEKYLADEAQVMAHWASAV